VLTCVAEVDHISFHFPVGPDRTIFGVFCDVAGGCAASSEVIVSCRWWMAFLISFNFPIPVVAHQFMNSLSFELDMAHHLLIPSFCALFVQNLDVYDGGLCLPGK
jgi:hypothetical protein